MRKELRIGGFGGQGVILAGIILGKAACLFDKNEAVQTQSYGPEARGGASKCEVVISDEKIDYPKVQSPDILVAMSHEALLKYIVDLKDKVVEETPLWKHFLFFMVFGPFYVLYLYIQDKKSREKNYIFTL